MKTSAKNVILTAIHFKGLNQVKKEAEDLAEKTLCSASYVKSIIRQVEREKVIIK